MAIFGCYKNTPFLGVSDTLFHTSWWSVPYCLGIPLPGGLPDPPKRGFWGNWTKARVYPCSGHPRRPPNGVKMAKIAKIPQKGAIRCNSPYCTYSMRYPIYGTLLPLVYYPVHVIYPSRWWYCTFLMIYHVFLTWSGHLDIMSSCHDVNISWISCKMCKIRVFGVF